MTEVGYGNLAWNKSIATAEKIGVKHYVVEQDQNFSKNPFESLRMSMEFLKNMLRGVKKRKVIDLWYADDFSTRKKNITMRCCALLHVRPSSSPNAEREFSPQKINYYTYMKKEDSSALFVSQIFFICMVAQTIHRSCHAVYHARHWQLKKRNLKRFVICRNQCL